MGIIAVVLVPVAVGMLIASAACAGTQHAAVERRERLGAIDLELDQTDEQLEVVPGPEG